MNTNTGNGASTMFALASELLAAGMCVVPARADKHPNLPQWTTYQHQLPIADEVDAWFANPRLHQHGIGFVCGLISGGLEVLDFDAKNDPSGTLNARAEAAIREFAPGLWERLPVEKTPSAGMHVYFRCAQPAKNLKLAFCLNADGKRMAVAETRGEGGFIVSAPTPGYVMVQGRLAAVPLITDDERSALFAAARSLDTAPIEKKPEPPAVNTKARTDFPTGYISPGDSYDQSEEWRTLLGRHGWTEAFDKHWTRPGKTSGTSATWDTLSDLPRHFYVFTPNAPPLQDNETYKPWHLFAHLECHGDFKLASKRLSELGFGTPPKPKPVLPDADIQAQIDAQNEEASTAPRESGNGLYPGDDPVIKRGLGYDWPEPVSADELCANPPPTPPELIQGILYAGGTMLLSGPSKSHKTFSALDAGIAIAAGERWLGHQTNKCVVLYANLELQDFASAERIAKISAARGHKPPPDLKIWNLRGHTISLDALTVQLPILIKKFGAKVVCIDPHYKVSSVSGMEENSNDSQGKLLTLLEGLCSQAGAALIITHHFAKGDASSKNAIDRASGGGVFARWGDVMMTFSEHKEPDCMSVEMALRNFAPVKPFVVRWEYPRWQRDDSLNAAELKKAKHGGFQEQVSADDLLSSLGSQLLSASEWIAASGVSKATFYRKRQELIDSGKVVCQMGTYKRT